jgi:N-acetylglutamate synthase-like GNAT family acetyltransferase
MIFSENRYPLFGIMLERRGRGDRVRRTAKPPRLSAIPLAAWEREGVTAALRKLGLPADDVASPGRMFWRFETRDLTPVGFGGLEIHDGDALLRSVVTLPPVRRRGIARAIVAALEAEARIADCRAIWLMTTSATPLFDQLGYAACKTAIVPQPIRETPEFAVQSAASATVMMKRLK